jgi:Leucine-rich repeat (LRR) protein
MNNTETDNLKSASNSDDTANQDEERSPDGSMPKKSRSRKWLYIVSSVFILLLFIFMDASNEARKREELETRINAMGGTVIETGFYSLREEIFEPRWVTGTLSINTYILLESLSITDLSPLGGLATIEDLNISSNKISDLSPLAGLINLRDLDVSDNPNLTLDEINKLKKALPNCTIIHNATK